MWFKNFKSPLFERCFAIVIQKSFSKNAKEYLGWSCIFVPEESIRCDSNNESTNVNLEMALHEILFILQKTHLGLVNEVLHLESDLVLCIGICEGRILYFLFESNHLALKLLRSVSFWFSTQAMNVTLGFFLKFTDFPNGYHLVFYANLSTLQCMACGFP